MKPKARRRIARVTAAAVMEWEAMNSFRLIGYAETPDDENVVVALTRAENGEYELWDLRIEKGKLVASRGASADSKRAAYGFWLAELLIAPEET